MCMIEGADDYVTVLSTSEPRARASHKCGECDRVISVGERYLKEATVFDGDFTTYRTCQHCQIVREWLQKECGGFLYHGLAEDIYEHYQERVFGFGVARLTFGISHRWTFKNKLMPVPRLPKVTA